MDIRWVAYFYMWQICVVSRQESGNVWFDNIHGDFDAWLNKERTSGLESFLSFTVLYPDDGIRDNIFERSRQLQKHHRHVPLAPPAQATGLLPCQKKCQHMCPTIKRAP